MRSTPRPRLSSGKDRTLVVALVCAALLFFSATAATYNDTFNQQQMLRMDTRFAHWILQQTHSEFVKSLAAVELYSAAPNAVFLKSLTERFALLRSSIDPTLMSAAQQLVPGSNTALERLQTAVDGYLATLLAGETPRRDQLEEWHERLLRWTRAIEQLSPADTPRRVDARPPFGQGLPAGTPFLLMALSGLGLVLLLSCQARREAFRRVEISRAQQGQSDVNDSLVNLMDTVPTALIVGDMARNNVLYANPAAAALIDRHALHRLLAAVDQALAQGGDDAVELSVPVTGGKTRRLLATLRPISWLGQTSKLVALEDVTGIRLAEQQVAAAGKMALQGEIASAISHEVAQPLAVIKLATSNAREMIQSGDLNNVIGQKLNRIDEQVERTKRIIEQVRLYSLLPQPGAEMFNAAKSIEQACDFVLEQYQLSSIDLIFRSCLPTDTYISGSHVLFEQALLNALINARDAFLLSPEEGGVDRCVEVDAYCEADQVTINVVDNAGGISPDVLGSLFLPFVSTKSEDGGTGLGLAIAQTSIAGMGGSIKAWNNDKGATFRFILPLQRPVQAELDAMDSHFRS